MSHVFRLTLRTFVGLIISLLGVLMYPYTEGATFFMVYVIGYIYAVIEILIYKDIR